MLETESEMRKLSEMDAEVGQWLSLNLPKAVPEYVKYLHETYKQIGVVLNKEKLLLEFEKFMKTN